MCIRDSLRNIGGDLGGAVKGFKKGMEEEGDDSDTGATEKLAADPDPADAQSAANSAPEAEVRKPGSEV